MTDKERFDEKWEENKDGCWIWTAGMKHRGYGSFWYNGENLSAHRASYWLHNDDHPEDEYVLHECGVKKCVNPDHLYLGTQSENLADAREHGVLHTGEENHTAKLTDDEAEEIRDRYKSEAISQADLADEYGVCQALISRLVNNKVRKQ